MTIKNREIDFPNAPLQENSYIKLSIKYTNGAYYFISCPVIEKENHQEMETEERLYKKLCSAPRYDKEKLEELAAQYANSPELAQFVRLCAKFYAEMLAVA